MNEQSSSTDTNESIATEQAPVAAPTKAKRKPAAKKPSVKKSAAKGEKKAAKRKGKKIATDGLTGPAVLKKYAPGYVKDAEHKTASGNPSVHCGDEVAKKFLGKDLDDIYKIVAKATETEEKDLRKKYAGLNLGMQRMNLGNRMRGVLNAK